MRYLDIDFLNCTCSIGFAPASTNDTRCDCICDPALSPYVTSCNYTARLLMKTTNSWISYENDTVAHGYITYTNCPFDYCHPQADRVNFSLPNGIDGQCVHGRTGVLCGMCKPNFSLSLGSSQCLPCHNEKFPVNIAIFLGSLIAGLLLATVVLVLNMTVAVGLIKLIALYFMPTL